MVERIGGEGGGWRYQLPASQGHTGLDLNDGGGVGGGGWGWGGLTNWKPWMARPAQLAGWQTPTIWFLEKVVYCVLWGRRLVCWPWSASCPAGWRKGVRNAWFVTWWKLGRTVRTACPGRSCSVASFWQYRLWVQVLKAQSSLIPRIAGGQGPVLYPPLAVSLGMCRLCRRDGILKVHHNILNLFFQFFYYATVIADKEI